MPQKQCSNKCPVCGGENIEWGLLYSIDAGPYQGGRCEDCETKFYEMYKYTHTEY